MDGLFIEVPYKGEELALDVAAIAREELDLMAAYDAVVSNACSSLFWFVL